MAAETNERLARLTGPATRGRWRRRRARSPIPVQSPALLAFVQDARRGNSCSKSRIEAPEAEAAKPEVEERSTPKPARLVAGRAVATCDRRS